MFDTYNFYNKLKDSTTYPRSQLCSQHCPKEFQNGIEDATQPRSVEARLTPTTIHRHLYLGTVNEAAMQMGDIHLIIGGYEAMR